MHRFTVFADYFQFVLMDENSQDDFSVIWTEEALHRMLAVASTAVCPGTLRNVDVSVEIEILEQAPEIELSAWDNAVEASINIPSGKLVVMGCAGYLPDSPRISVAPGTYQLLSLAGGIGTIQNEWESAPIAISFNTSACRFRILFPVNNSGRHVCDGSNNCNGNFRLGRLHHARTGQYPSHSPRC